MLLLLAVGVWTWGYFCLMLSSWLFVASAVGVASFSLWCVHSPCHCGAAAPQAEHDCQRRHGNNYSNQNILQRPHFGVGAISLAMLARAKLREFSLLVFVFIVVSL
jgi:hypothetical protein